MLKPACIIFMILLQVQFLSAQKAFLNLYGISDSDYGNSVLANVDGGYALINQTQYAGKLLPQLIKTDCNGNIEWTRAFGFGEVCIGFDLETVNTNFALLLLYRDVETGNYLTAVTLVDALGNLVWSTTLPLQTTYGNDNLIVEEDGFVVCGNSNNMPSTSPTTTLVRLDGNGDVMYAKNIQLPTFCTPMGITRLSMGKYAVLGGYPSPDFPSAFKDVSVVLTDEHFIPLKAVVYATYYDDEAMSITTDNDNNIYVCGRSYFIGNNWDAFLLRFNTDLDLVTVKNYDAGTPEGEVFRNITMTLSATDLVMCGDIGTFEERAPMVVKTDRSGNILFSKKYDVSPFFTNYLFSIVPALDHGFALTGDFRPPTSERDAPLLKIDRYGNDSCYAESFTLTPYVPAYTMTTILATSIPMFYTGIDTLPVVENIPIHQVDVCNAQNPCPSFVFDPHVECPSLCFDFENQSVGGDTWHWEFEGGNPAFSDVQHPADICYTVDGTYNVKLIVSNSLTGGVAVLEKNIAVTVGCNPVFPNIITPDGNGINDVFSIEFLPAEYDLRIFNRWGMLVDAFNEGDPFWNGCYPKGTKVTQGVYYYTFVNRITGNVFNGFVQVAY